MPKKTKSDSQPGALDDDAQRRARQRRKQQEAQIRAIFDDNKTGRPQDPDGRD